MGNTWLGSTEGALLIGWYLIALKTECAFYIFAVGLGLARLATVLRTAAIVGKLFGIRCLATTLFGLTLLPDQIGGLLGAYLGRIALAQSGDYHWMWCADMALAAAAAVLVCRSGRIRRALTEHGIPRPAVTLLRDGRSNWWLPL
jgi:hypothetical protein